MKTGFGPFFCFHHFLQAVSFLFMIALFFIAR